jgi:hypothetical protein
LFILALVNLNEAICGNVIWPLLPFLVRRYSLPEDVGVYVGLLAASFFLGQVLFVRAWGRAADRWGRRPVLLVGLLVAPDSALGRYRQLLTKPESNARAQHLHQLYPEALEEARWLAQPLAPPEPPTSQRAPAKSER